MKSYHLLDFDLLERTEPARTGLHMKRAADIVLLALRFILAIENRRELLVRDVLKCFRTTNIASVRVDFQKWLDFRHTRHDAADCDELPEVDTFHFAYGHGNVRAQGLKIEVTRRYKTRAVDSRL